jgi:hypothetical protein
MVPKQVINILSAIYIFIGDPAPIDVGGYLYLVSVCQACGSDQYIPIRLVNDTFPSLAH